MQYSCREIIRQIRSIPQPLSLNHRIKVTRPPNPARSSVKSDVGLSQLAS